MKGIGIIVLVGILLFGAVYIFNLTGIANNLNPDSLFGGLVRGFQTALNGLQASISGMFSNFTR